jgi:predicted DNA binding CopG/RHH family protein
MSRSASTEDKCSYMAKKPITTPALKTESEEREFWRQTDLSKHVTREDFELVTFPNLKPTSIRISIRLPEYLLLRVKERAHSLDIPYQSLIKQFIAEGLKL